MKSSRIASKIHAPVLDVLCGLLNLTPRVQWWEALRLRGLPQVTTRITFTDPYVWQRTEAAFAQQLAEESDYLYAASQLLLDVWLWITGCHSSVNESPFLILAKLTRQIDFPPSHIAHCIRDIAYGDKPRVKDLEAMIHSKDPAYRTIFVEACWVDIEELQVKKQREKKRRR